MRIDHCLILAAGFGTRMGSIGQKLPKVLWPVFEKSLLELQVAYARSLGIEKIYINLHYMGEQIEEYCKSKSTFEGVTFLWEKPEILDIGGAIHNLASLPNVKYKGKLLVLNADQFFYLKKEDLIRILTPFEKNAGVLFSYWVNSSLGYNALEVDSSRLVKSILKNKDLPQDKKIETYTGISYIDLAQLEKVPGVSSFFESVCPFNRKDIPAILLENVDYWDFGTVKRYWETCFNILSTYRTKSTHPFLRFLVQERAMKTWKIDLQNLSYHASSPKVINLNSEVEVKELGPCIILKGNDVKKTGSPSVWWDELVEEVK
jgi:NDP-sugar pyrophosphorylase family protein